MITRRGFIMTSGTAMSALSLAGAGPVAAAFAGEKMTIASPARPMAANEQGLRHIVLTGNRIDDVQTLEMVLAQKSTSEMTLSLDAADQVLFEIALTRTPAVFAPVAAAPGLMKFRRTSFAGV